MRLDIAPRPPPRYHFGKLLLAFILFILYETLSFATEFARHGKAQSSSPAEFFEVFTKVSGEVVICTSTADGSGTATSRPIFLGRMTECPKSDAYVRKLRSGKRGCLAFSDIASAELFMACVADEHQL